MFTNRTLALRCSRVFYIVSNLLKSKPVELPAGSMGFLLALTYPQTLPKEILIPMSLCRVLLQQTV